MTLPKMTVGYPLVCLVLYLTAVSAWEESVADNITCPSGNLTELEPIYDVVFIMDRSGDESQLNVLKNSIKLMTRSFDISNIRTRLALVTFAGQEANELLDLGTNNNEVLFRDYLMAGVQPGPPGRNLAKAFRWVRQNVLLPASGDRGNVKNLCIVVTGGPADVDVADTVPEANLLAAQCEVVIVTNDPDASNLAFYNSLSADDEVFQGNVADPNILSQTLKDFGDLGCATPEECNNRCDTPDRFLCCGPNGQKVLGFNGCCRCLCDEGFSGSLCENESELLEITKLTHANGSNTFFSLNASSIDPNRPLKKSLFRRDFNNDPYDMYFSFVNGDPNPVYNIIFEGETRLHFLMGQLAAATEGASVTITAFDEDGNQVNQKVINIPKNGSFPHLDYTDFMINYGSDQVSRVEFRFNKPCECEGCYGINAVKGAFSRLIGTAGDRTCGAFFECFQNAEPLNSFGCCRCPTIDEDQTFVP